MNSGCKPTPVSHKDYSFTRTYGVALVPDFPSEYTVDAGLWTPDQNRTEPIFNNPAYPFGCTNYGCADAPADIDGVLKNPALLEYLSHANQNGGADVRSQLEWCLQPDLLRPKRLGWVTSFFNVHAHTPLDSFDAIRFAIISGVPEKRCVVTGTPWYGIFEAVGNDGILSTPNDMKNIGSWHCHNFVGWKTINGKPYLISKSWQGTNYGDKGFVYFSRELTNAIFDIPGSVAYTVTRMGINAPIKKVDLGIVDWIMSHLRQLLPLSY